MAHTRWFGITGITVAMGCTGLLLSARLVMPVQAASHETEHERSSTGRCSAAVGDHHSSIPASTVAGARQGVTVSVPAIAVIRVDDLGRVVSAMTNTGCAPTRREELWLMASDGSMQAATAERFAGHRWTGDFSEAGKYVAQRDSDASRDGSHQMDDE